MKSSNRKIYDISMQIYEGMPVYKNKAEKQPKFEITSDHAPGSVRETRIHMDAHTGTHVDAPLHMVQSGATIETITLEHLVRPCRVVDLLSVEKEIHAADLQDANVQSGEFILLKTKNSLENVFNFEFVFVAEDAARYLAERKIAGVGVDGLGIERSQSGHPTHKALFEVDAIIIEGLRLAEVPAGEYLMVAAPLKLVGIEAAPARILLIQEN